MISYYIHKFIQTLGSLKLAILLPYTTLQNWIIRYTPKGFEFDNHVVLGFWDTTLFHLGDQLFHIGLIRSLQDAGIKVTICGNTPLQPFFKRMNVYFAEKKDLRHVKGALVISKDDIFFAHLRANRKNAFLGINYRFTKSKQRIGEILFEETRKSLELFGKNIEMKKEFWNLSLESAGLEAQNFNLPSQTFLYNDFVASNAVSAYQRLPVMTSLAERLSRQGNKIIYVGSPAEKRQRQVPHFIIKDLRGEIPLSELFSFANQSSIEGIITFDTLWAHIANLVGKKAYVVNKQERNQDNIWNRFVPMSEYVGGEIERY